MPKYEGIEVRIGGAAYVAPPLNLKGFRKVAEVVGDLVGSADLPAQMRALSVMLSASLIRNYDFATEDWVEESLQGPEIVEVMKMVPKILDASGFAPRKADTSGEAPAAPSTGTT